MTGNQVFTVKKAFMIEIESKLDKSRLAVLPKVVFDGLIEEIDSVEKAEKAINELSMEEVVGFDTETRPSFEKGSFHKIALLQLSTARTAYLFRLNVIGIPDCVADFLSDAKVTKVGLSVKDDFCSLGSRRIITPSGFVNIPDICGEMGIEEKGLQKIFAILFGQRISKNQQLSNWEIESLTEGQRQYAAIDAWACLMIYLRLKELRTSGDYRIIRDETEENNTETR